MPTRRSTTRSTDTVASFNSTIPGPKTRRGNAAVSNAISATLFDRSEFFLVFQPIFALDNNHIAGCEALLRWRHPTLGVRQPAEFVHIMEETGLINEIGHWVFLDACKAAAAWPKQIRVCRQCFGNTAASDQYLV